LPMLLVEANGEVCKLEDAISGINVEKRKRSGSGSRRIRFLSKCKDTLGVRIVVDGLELTPKR